MRTQRISLALGAAGMVLSLGACGDGDDKSSDDSGGGNDETTATSTAESASPDGTYSSAVGPNEEQVTLKVEDDTIVHLKAKVAGDCGGTTSSSESEGAVEIPIAEGAVTYTAEANGSTTTLTGTFVDGTFDGTYANVNPAASCPTDPFAFTASAG